MFIQHLANEAHNQAKLDRKPRRNVQYKDLGTSSLGVLQYTFSRSDGPRF